VRGGRGCVLLGRSGGCVGGGLKRECVLLEGVAEIAGGHVPLILEIMMHDDQCMIHCVVSRCGEMIDGKAS
jgi:hypothetical protein